MDSDFKEKEPSWSCQLSLHLLTVLGTQNSLSVTDSWGVPVPLYEEEDPVRDLGPYDLRRQH